MSSLNGPSDNGCVGDGAAVAASNPTCLTAIEAITTAEKTWDSTATSSNPTSLTTSYSDFFTQDTSGDCSSVTISSCVIKLTGCVGNLNANKAALITLDGSYGINIVRSESGGFEVDICLKCTDSNEEEYDSNDMKIIAHPSCSIVYSMITDPPAE
jgi:hypothetical protein